MQIADYSFGQLTAAENKYTSDLLICGEEIKSNWWRQDGHSLCLDDLDWVLAKNPDTLIIGTGKSGVMSVPADVKADLEAQGIEVIVETTDQAVEIFNRRQNSDKLVAAGFHLTC
jgi:hypothetical protein